MLAIFSLPLLCFLSLDQQKHKGFIMAAGLTLRLPFHFRPEFMMRA